MEQPIKIIPIHNPKGEKFNVQLINQLLNDDLEIDGKKPNKYKSEQIEILIVTGKKTLNEVYVPACTNRILKNRNDNIIMTIRDGDVFFVIKSGTKPQDIPGLIKRKHPDRELHIIIFVNDKINSCHIIFSTCFYKL